MGLSCTCVRKILNTIAKSLSENHCKLFKHFIEAAIEHKWLLVLIIDDKSRTNFLISGTTSYLQISFHINITVFIFPEPALQFLKVKCA